jgi:holo-[acyl-carrier protein] synthase
MNVLGIGVDIVENARIRAMLESHGERFLVRVFTDAERAYCSPMRDPAPFFAARFAAKEAVAKAFGTGIGKEMEWRHIEVVRAESGQPSIVLHESAAAYAQQRGVSTVIVSLSHSEHYALAQAMILGG